MVSVCVDARAPFHPLLPSLASNPSLSPPPLEPLQVLDELMGDRVVGALDGLIRDQYGNYVIQHIIQCVPWEHTPRKAPCVDPVLGTPISGQQPYGSLTSPFASLGTGAPRTGR